MTVGSVRSSAARRLPTAAQLQAQQQGAGKVKPPRADPKTTTKVLSAKTASKNHFSVKVAGSAIDSNGNLSYAIKVKYEDTAGLFKGTNEIVANATGAIAKTTFGKGGGVDTNLQQATASALTRTGPNTFEGTIQFPLSGEKGKFREDVSSMKFMFGQLKDNSWADAKFDGKPWQDYTVPLKLVGKR